MSFLGVLKNLKVKLNEIAPNSESEVEHKCILPFLESLGYTKPNGVEYKYRIPRNVSVGSHAQSQKHFLEIIPDIAVYIDGEPFMIVDSKRRTQTIDVGDGMQVVSYARLYEDKVFHLAVVSTCVNWEVYDPQTRDLLGDHRAIPQIDRAKALLKKPVLIPDYKKEQAERFIATRRLIKDEQELRGIFGKCYTLIDGEGKKFHEALEEMSKLILAKIFEEESSEEEKRDYRFKVEFIDEQLRLNPRIKANDHYEQNNAAHVIEQIFDEANDFYKGKRPEPLFPKGTKITLKPGTVKEIVKTIQEYAFYGAGEDIKGVVYETFLKEIFRGEKGQFFTPREIVKFAVSLVDPKPGERILDPSCGSGGFLIQSFIEVQKKIKSLPVSAEEKTKRIERLLEQDLWGLDNTETLVRFCKINLIIQGDGYKNVFHRDSLAKNDDFLKELEGTFDIVVANPPFDLPQEYKEHIINDYEVFTKEKYDGADVLFLERCYDFCKPGGRIAIVVPHRFIDAKNFIRLRRWISEKMILRAVISLPAGVFMPFGGSNARTAILYLRKPLPDEERKGDILMSTVKHVGFETGIQGYKPLETNDLDIISLGEQLAELKTQEEETYGIR